MNKKTLWILCLIVFIGSLVLLNKYLTNSSNSINLDDKTVYSDEELDQETVSSSIIQITSSNFEEIVLNSNKTVLIDFYADWCPPCKKLSPIIEEVASENTDENLVFARINIDDEQNLAAQYGIQPIPTLILIKAGKEEDRSIGYIGKSELKEFIKQ